MPHSKQKLLASIVAISAIQVLKAFMNIDATFDTQKLGWLAGIHVVFVLCDTSDRVVGSPWRRSRQIGESRALKLRGGALHDGLHRMELATRLVEDGQRSFRHAKIGAVQI